MLSTFDTGDLANQSSLIWTRYGLSFTASQSTVRLELVNNAPGGGGNDLALDDIGDLPVCEYGDAPNSYGTLIASGGPVHAQGAPHLGATVDFEGDGQPTTAANGDDLNRVDDEDGVAFNPALGYPNPTIRTGTDPVTLPPVANTFTRRTRPPPASPASGSTGTRTATSPTPASGSPTRSRSPPGTTTHVRQGSNPADIRTYVRVRYSTDAAVDPSRPAPRRTARSRTTGCWSSG